MDGRIKEIWDCTYKYDYCIAKYEDGRAEIIDPAMVKALLKTYEVYLKHNDLKEVTGSNSKLTLSIDDRLPMYLNSLGINSIQFINKGDLKNGNKGGNAQTNL